MYILLQNYSILCILCKTCLYIVLHDFNLTYYSSIILGSFSILLFPKLCWHIGLTPRDRTGELKIGGDDKNPQQIDLHDYES